MPGVWKEHSFHFIPLLILYFPSNFSVVYSRCNMNVVVQLPSCVSFFATPWTAAHRASLSFTNFGSLPKFMSLSIGLLT